MKATLSTGLLFISLITSACGTAADGVPSPRADETTARTAAAVSGGTSYNGGPLISNVHVVPVLWGAVSPIIQREMQCYYAAITNGPYIDMLSEYGTSTKPIGRGSAAQAVTISPTHTGVSLTQSDVHSELVAQIAAGVLPVPDANTIYMVHTPPGVSVYSPRNDASTCNGGLCGFHETFPYGSLHVPFAIVQDPSSCKAGCGSTPFNGVLDTASHELAEAITDPQVTDSWYPEIGDACESNPGEAPLPGTFFVVQPLWSNARGGCYSPPSGTSTTDPPVITSITPAQGPYDSPTSVTITGSCFADPRASVTMFGTTFIPVTATVTSSSLESLTVTMPASPSGQVGIGTLDLFNLDGSGPAAASFSYLASGAITVSPASGPMQGGTRVLLQGQPLPTTNAVRVTFGGVPATGVQCTSSPTPGCTAFAPAHDPGTVDVVVTYDGVSRTAYGAFTYLGPQITSVTPASGPITGGTLVTVHGVNMAPTTVNAFTAPASFGNLPPVNVSCVREGINDASCTMRSPAVASVGTVDVHLTMTNSTGTPVPTAIGPADHFQYTLLPALYSLDLGGSAVGGATVTGTVALNGNAPSTGAIVQLALAPGAPAGVLQFPASVPVTAGASATFPVTVVNQDYTGTVAVVATYGGTTVTGTLKVSPTPPPVLGALSPLCSLHSVTETITLAEPAPSSGGVVTLWTDSGAAVVPTTVNVAPYATTAQFTVSAAKPTTTTKVRVSASYAGVLASPVYVTVLPPTAVTISLPSSVYSGTTAAGSIGSCGAAPAGGLTVSVSSSDATTTVPATVTIPYGATSTPLDVATTASTVTRYASITATSQGYTTSDTLEILGAPQRCALGTQLCTCSDGAHACLATASECLTYCRSH